MTVLNCVFNQCAHRHSQEFVSGGGGNYPGAKGADEGGMWGGGVLPPSQNFFSFWSQNGEFLGYSAAINLSFSLRKSSKSTHGVGPSSLRFLVLCQSWIVGGFAPKCPGPWLHLCVRDRHRSCDTTYSQSKSQNFLVVWLIDRSMEESTHYGLSCNVYRVRLKRSPLQKLQYLQNGVIYWYQIFNDY